jgi:hypothetical protein
MLELIYDFSAGSPPKSYTPPQTSSSTQEPKAIVTPMLVDTADFYQQAKPTGFDEAPPQEPSETATKPQQAVQVNRSPKNVHRSTSGKIAAVVSQTGERPRFIMQQHYRVVEDPREGTETMPVRVRSKSPIGVGNTRLSDYYTPMFKVSIVGLETFNANVNVDTDWFVRLSYAGRECETLVRRSSQGTTIWDEDFYFDVRLGHLLKFEIEDGRSHGQLGSCELTSVNIENWSHHPEYHHAMSVRLPSQVEERGILTIKLELTHPLTDPTSWPGTDEVHVLKMLPVKKVNIPVMGMSPITVTRATQSYSWSNFPVPTEIAIESAIPWHRGTTYSSSADFPFSGVWTHPPSASSLMRL